MSTQQVIEGASQPTFYNRVAYIALKVAQNVATEADSTPNHANRLMYCARIFAGDDSALLLSNHVSASNPTIASILETQGPDAVPDADIEFALGAIWDSRANSFAAASPG